MTESDEPMTVDKRLENQSAVLQEHGQALAEHGKLLQSLRVLYEHHDGQIQRIAEVQTAHGVKLDQHGKLLVEIRGALKPLPEIHDFVKRIASEHEVRMTALENRR